MGVSTEGYVDALLLFSLEMGLTGMDSGRLIPRVILRLWGVSLSGIIHSWSSSLLEHFPVSFTENLDDFQVIKTHSEKASGYSFPAIHRWPKSTWVAGLVHWYTSSYFLHSNFGNYVFLLFPTRNMRTLSHRLVICFAQASTAWM